MPAGFKPSPLGYGSPRSSPFRRPESPAASSPLRQSTPPGTPSRLGHARTPSRLGVESTPVAAPASPDFSRSRPLPQPETMASPRLGSPVSLRSQAPAPAAGGNALSQLQPQQLRVLRDGFQILDRDSDGSVNREDVADMMTQLGMFQIDSTRSRHLLRQCARHVLQSIRAFAVLPIGWPAKHDTRRVSQQYSKHLIGHVA